MDLIKLRRKVVLYVVSLLVFSLVVLSSYFRIFDNYELETLDIRYRLRPPIPVNKNIAIIEIGDDTIDKLGKWPISRKYHATLIEALTEAGVDAIVFDIFFSEESQKDADKSLEEAIKKSGKVYLPYVFNIVSKGGNDVPIADRIQEAIVNKFKKYARGTGFINIIPDSDGKFRRVPPIIKYQNKLFPHVCFLVFNDYLGLKKSDMKVQPGRYAELGDKLKVPLDSNSTIIVNFPGKWKDTFRHYSYIDVIDSHISAKFPSVIKRKPTVDLKKLKNSICFIGVTATATPDAHPSPFNVLYPGVGVNASLFNSFLTKNFIRRVTRLNNIFALLGLCFITYLISKRVRALYGLIWTLISTIGYVILASTLFFTNGLWLDVFYPVTVVFLLYLAVTFIKYVGETHKIEIMERDLSIAKRIQESFLPKKKPDMPGINVAASMVTAKQVGGDLYDFIKIEDKKFGIMIGDVSGKGVPAALYMAKVVSEFRSYSKENLASETVSNLNNQLCKEFGSGLFVTLSYAIFDMEKNLLSYSSGGHLPMILVKRGSSVPERIDVKEGAPLGLFEGKFEEKAVKFEKGDLFILYTDGVTEAMNAKNEMFDEKKLLGLAENCKNLSTEETVDVIQNKVKEFEGKKEQHDDITVVAVRIA